MKKNVVVTVSIHIDMAKVIYAVAILAYILL